MAPFPESEDMTVKRLYVALKRGDMQLLQMGAHKLHEKFYTGYTFLLLDDLRRILSYVEEQSIPNDIKELMTTTITKILNGEKPEKISVPLEFTGEETRVVENSNENEYNSEQNEVQNEALNSEDNSSHFINVSENNSYQQAQQAYNSAEITGSTVVFYDDKAPHTNYIKNKMYRHDIESIGLDIEANPNKNLMDVINIVDVQTEGLDAIVKMIASVKGDVSFITTSKSKNIIKAFVENNVNFDIPLVTNQGCQTRLIPLFGLSNMFVCPKCGEREYFAGMHNNVLSLQCKKCSCAMYPDVYEAENFETNANMYWWMFANTMMAKAKNWILINPPAETNKLLVSEFIRMAYRASRPDKIYILSKEASKREFYRQMFLDIDSSVEIKADFVSETVLMEEFLREGAIKLGV